MVLQVGDGAPKVHHCPPSFQAPVATNSAQATVCHQNRRLLLFTPPALPTPSLASGGQFRPLFPFFSLFLFSSRFLALVKSINFAFRRKIRSYLNPNFRLFEKSQQINDSRWVGSSTRFDLLDGGAKSFERLRRFCVGINIRRHIRQSWSNSMKEGKPVKVMVERLRRGEDVLVRLNQFVLENGITAANFTALGAVEKASVGFFVGGGQYSTVVYDGPLEVLSCVGNVSLKEGKPFIHGHLTIADKKGNAYGGHLQPGCIVSATFEVTMLVYEGVDLVRKLDSATKLYLLDT